MENLPIDPSLLELNQVLKEADDLYRSATRRLGVPECTLWVLYSLRVWPGPITQTQLCQLIHQPKQTINSALKAMEAKGHITLSPGSDRRTREITLTPRGWNWQSRPRTGLFARKARPWPPYSPHSGRPFCRPTANSTSCCAMP